jgi:hypothetical protein
LEPCRPLGRKGLVAESFVTRSLEILWSLIPQRDARQQAIGGEDRQLILMKGTGSVLQGVGIEWLLQSIDSAK